MVSRPCLLEVMPWSMKWSLSWWAIADVYYPNLLAIRGYDFGCGICNLSFHIFKPSVTLNYFNTNHTLFMQWYLELFDVMLFWKKMYIPWHGMGLILFSRLKRREGTLCSNFQEISRFREKNIYFSMWVFCCRDQVILKCSPLKSLKEEWFVCVCVRACVCACTHFLKIMRIRNWVLSNKFGL